jgi:hypothetical protein
MESNTELRELYKQQYLVQELKSGWLGHIVRKEDSGMMKILFVTNSCGKKTLGRPRKRWLDVETDLRNMGVKRWRLKIHEKGMDYNCQTC